MHCRVLRNLGSPQPSVLVSAHSSKKWIIWYVLSYVLCLPIYLSDQITQFLNLTPFTELQDTSLWGIWRVANCLVKEHWNRAQSLVQLYYYVELLLLKFYTLFWALLFLIPLKMTFISLLRMKWIFLTDCGTKIKCSRLSQNWNVNDIFSIRKTLIL